MNLFQRVSGQHNYCFSALLDHECTAEEILRKKLVKDWKEEMTSLEKKITTSLSTCDFYPDKPVVQSRQKRIWLLITDNHRERFGTFKIEPPGLFCGRGNHPRMGKLKKQVLPEGIIINWRKDAKVPSPPPGRKWKEVRHADKGTWLISRTENIRVSITSIWLNPSSRIKGEKDWQKHETARRQKMGVDQVCSQYREDCTSKEVKSPAGQACHNFSDKLALPAGNEKEGDTPDPVGCCLLRAEHIILHPELDGQEHRGEFDFLGKDSVRYYNKVSIEKRVFKNLQLHSLDLVLLWLGCRPAATVPIRPLVWELPYATGVALKRQKKKKKKKKEEKKKKDKRRKTLDWGWIKLGRR
uniref:DNA topoisomerase 1 n=1 Tax=Sus scrofa TaxID=9823 RepID=A0A8W4F7R9_PIG